jgi:hypothetical protein
MSCDYYERFEKGSLSGEDLARHARECAGCRDQAALDARLDGEVAALRAPIGSEGLWERIEATLRREKEAADARAWAPARRAPRFDARRWLVLAPAGAALLALAVFGVLTLRRPPAPSGILTSAALARVEVEEREYAAAIDALAREAKPKLAAMDIQMMSLYRDKLSTIDAQIERCREALGSNPANAHIRGYLLAALKDKKQALAEMLGPVS